MYIPDSKKTAEEIYTYLRQRCLLYTSMECGSCSYVCPSKRYLVQAIRTAKRQIIANRKKAEGGRG